MSRQSTRSRRVRTVTGLLAVTIASVGLTGCTDSSSPRPPDATTVPRPPTADELAQADAVTRTRTLLDDAASARPRTQARRTLVSAVASGHAFQLTALGVTGSGTTPDTSSGTTPGATAGAGGAPSTSGTPTDSPASPPDSPPDSPTDPTTSPTAAVPTVAMLSRREFEAAEQTLGAVAGVEPGLATLLARLAAGFAVNADLLARSADRPVPGAVEPAVASAGGAGSLDTSPGGSSPTAPGPAATTSGDSGTGADGGTGADAGTGSPSGPSVTTPALSRDAINALSQEVAAEHAAVYAFGLVAGRLDGSRRDRALKSYEAHLRLRDALERSLLAAGVDPPVAAPAYDLGKVPSTDDQVKALAARVESALAAAAAQTVGAAEGQARTDAAVRLVEAARRAAYWTGRPSPLPGQGITASAGPTPGPTAEPTG